MAATRSSDSRAAVAMAGMVDPGGSGLGAGWVNYLTLSINHDPEHADLVIEDRETAIAPAHHGAWHNVLHLERVETQKPCRMRPAGLPGGASTTTPEKWPQHAGR